MCRQSRGHRGADGGPLQAEAAGGSGCTACARPVSSFTIQSAAQVPTSPESWIMIRIPNDNMQREAVRRWNQVPGVWKV